MNATVERQDALQRSAGEDGGQAGGSEAARSLPVPPTQVESWLARARGAAIPGMTTATVLALTRGDD